MFARNPLFEVAYFRKNKLNFVDED
jgi:hypothetical protein